MIDCLILGDSIAVGVGQARPACETVAKTGINSSTFVQTLLPTAPKAARTIVISLGVNDGADMPTLATLQALRSRVLAQQVTWLLPAIKDNVRRAIRTVAAHYNDRIVDTAGQAGPDHLHPTGDGYRLIAAWTQDTNLPAAQPQGRQQLAMALVPPAGPASNLPRVITAGSPLRWQPMLAPGAAGGPGYANWPPPHATFAAIPPASYSYRAFLPLPAISQR